MTDLRAPGSGATPPMTAAAAPEAHSVASDAQPDEPIAAARPTSATWQSRPAVASWCPDELAAALPWAQEVSYSDRVALEVRAGSKHLIAISQRGRVHAHDGTHREDAVALRDFPGGFVLAVADGAGSSRWSRVGSAFACREVEVAALAFADGTEVAGGDAMREALVDAVAQCCDRLQLAATSAGAEARDFRTTLLVALCVGDVLATLQVGDGAIVALSRTGVVRRLGVTDSGSYSGEVSAFLPELDRAALTSRVTLGTWSDLEAVVVVSDGIEDPFYPIERRGSEVLQQLYGGVQAPSEGFATQRPHGPVVDHPDALAHLTEWIAFERRGENDDRTLAGAFRLPPRAGH